MLSKGENSWETPGAQPNKPNQSENAETVKLMTVEHKMLRSQENNEEQIDIAEGREVLVDQSAA